MRVNVGWTRIRTQSIAQQVVVGATLVLSAARRDRTLIGCRLVGKLAQYVFNAMRCFRAVTGA